MRVVKEVLVNISIDFKEFLVIDLAYPELNNQNLN